MRQIPIITSIAGLSDGRRVWFVDIWGVLHDGVRPFAGAVGACRAFRAVGGRVVLVSNAPRPFPSVIAQLDGIGVPGDCYDIVLTSGDISRGMVARYAGQTVYHVGPQRDLPLFDGTGVELGSPEIAAAVVCTGLVDDETETPETYRAVLAPLAGRGVPMVCANPDLKVERAGRIIPCAGAMAEMYGTMGGPVAYAGKPHPPIYEAAHAAARDLTGRALNKAEILAIGDGVLTDIDGATRFGIDSVYVASAVSLGHSPFEPAALDRLFPDASARPLAAMSELAW
jgi:HAD superfamily hydrolase (TIGR01459 family)